LRSIHAVGLSDAPIDEFVCSAVMRIATATEPTIESSHAARRNRTVRMYSTPSGQATTMSTSDPKSTARARVATSRARPSAPPTREPSSASSACTPVEVTGSGAAVTAGTVEPVASVAATVVVSGAGAVGTTTASAVMLNVMPTCPLGCASGELTVSSTLHVPFGIGFGTATVAVMPSAPICALPTGKASPLQVVITVADGPSGSANTNVIDVGDVGRVSLLAGVELTRVLSA
jgi:hypothetical protein